MPTAQALDMGCLLIWGWWHAEDWKNKIIHWPIMNNIKDSGDFGWITCLVRANTQPLWIGWSLLPLKRLRERTLVDLFLSPLSSLSLWNLKMMEAGRHDDGEINSEKKTKDEILLYVFRPFWVSPSPFQGKPNLGCRFESVVGWCKHLI
jgi:hypothetical protein